MLPSLKSAPRPDESVVHAVDERRRGDWQMYLCTCAVRPPPAWPLPSQHVVHRTRDAEGLLVDPFSVTIFGQRPCIDQDEPSVLPCPPRLLLVRAAGIRRPRARPKSKRIHEHFSPLPFLASSPLEPPPRGCSVQSYYETTMPIPIAFLLLLFFLLATVPSSRAAAAAAVDALPQPRGFYISCGADKEVQAGSIRWVPDAPFIAVGNASAINKPNILPLFSTVRYFPDATARKYCYTLPAVKGTRYLVRTTYFYGGFDGGADPPVFDQIVDGTLWSAVNTTDTSRRGMSTYFEMVAQAQGKTMSVCLARRPDTKSSPFISSLELINLEDSMYNTTDFGKYVLTTVARSALGSKGDIISYPDDQYNRYWAPFTDGNPTVESHSPISPADFWNLPPAKALKGGLTTSRGKNLTVQWPPVELPLASYYVALYFQDSRTASPYSWRVFDVAVNGKAFFQGLNASAAGVVVYSNMMQLAGKPEILLTPNATSPVGPLINAAEIYQIVPVGGRTATRDVIAMEDLARSLKNPPPDWAGDPCLPPQYSWTGVSCSTDSPVRVLSLDLKNHSLSGSLPDSIGNLTGMQTIFLGGNKLSGPIPDLSNMQVLTALHLHDNQFSGTINPSLEKIANLKELYLYNNNLTGQIPASLKTKPGLIMRTEGNKLQ